MKQLAAVIGRIGSEKISDSKTFFLNKVMKNFITKVAEDPWKVFVSAIKRDEILGSRVLFGTVGGFYANRDKPAIKEFFVEPQIWDDILEDFAQLLDHASVPVAMTDRGIVVYDNYKKDRFNVLLTTMHNGQWLPENLRKKSNITKEQRYGEEDIKTGLLYGNLVLNNAGIWIDNKQSRFACDFNRSIQDCIYTDRSEEWINKIWNGAFNVKEINTLHKSYVGFYRLLEKLVDTYRFNIFIDGHSMKDGKGRADISFCTGFTPRFYLPIVKSMARQLKKAGYDRVGFNEPFPGGHLPEWFAQRFSDVFVIAIEINKKLYMKKDRTQCNETQVKKLAKDLELIFDIGGDDV